MSHGVFGKWTHECATGTPLLEVTITTYLLVWLQPRHLSESSFLSCLKAHGLKPNRRPEERPLPLTTGSAPVPGHGCSTSPTWAVKHAATTPRILRCGWVRKINKSVCDSSQVPIARFPFDSTPTINADFSYPREFTELLNFPAGEVRI